MIKQLPPAPRLLVLLAALLPCCAAPLPAQVSGRDPNSELLRYIKSENADPSCGVCLTAARGRSENAGREKLLKKTAGMIKVPAGDYKIGAEKGGGEPDELPRHSVLLDAFYIDAREVTLAEYRKFMKAAGENEPEWARPGGKFNIETGKDPYYRRLEELLRTCPSCPVFGVFWQDANAYCRWKNRRLPTEAEWEAAAAGGSTAKFSFGDSAVRAGDFSWSKNNSGELPQRTGNKTPNALGLYDMHGNVWEWVHDFYDKEYYARSPKKSPEGPPSGRDHVIRGGSWASSIDQMAVTNRASHDSANDDIGFRCAVSESALAGETGVPELRYN